MVNPNAPDIVKEAFTELSTALNEAARLPVMLNQSSVLLFNNVRTLHCRNTIRDPRRLLIRIHGYSKNVVPDVYSKDPLICRAIPC